MKNWYRILFIVFASEFFFGARREPFHHSCEILMQLFKTIVGHQAANFIHSTSWYVRYGNKSNTAIFIPFQFKAEKWAVAAVRVLFREWSKFINGAIQKLSYPISQRHDIMRHDDFWTEHAPKSATILGFNISPTSEAIASESRIIRNKPIFFIVWIIDIAVYPHRKDKRIILKLENRLFFGVFFHSDFSLLFQLPDSLRWVNCPIST